MTKRPSQPDSKPASKTAGGGRAEENVAPGSMTRFRKLAKKVVSVTREELAAATAKEERAKKRKL